MPKGLTGYRQHLNYISMNKRGQEIAQRLRESQSPEDFIQRWLTQYNQNEINRSVYRLVRILSGSYQTCLKTVQGQFGGIQPTHFITFVPKDPTKLRVYINFKIDPVDSSCYKQAGAWTHPEPAASLVNTINTELNHEQLRIGWATLARARGRLKKYEDMSVVKAITKFTNARGRLSEEQIAQCSDALVDSRKPADLIFAKTPREIQDMYGSGPSSCMSAKDNTRSWSALLSAGSHPCAFFSYHPYIRGVYIKNSRGVVRARVFLYTLEDGKEYYGRIYGSTTADITCLRASLHTISIYVLPSTHGENLRDNSGLFYRSCEFDIPGIKQTIGSADDYVMPYPYLDNLKGYTVLSYDPGTHMFHVKLHSWEQCKKIVKNAYPAWDAYQAGLIPASSLVA